MKENPNPQDLIIAKLLPFPNKSKIKDAVNFNNPKVRNFALAATIFRHKSYCIMPPTFVMAAMAGTVRHFPQHPTPTRYTSDRALLVGFIGPEPS